MKNPRGDTTIPSASARAASSSGDAGLFSPRFALLAAMFYNPLILLGYLIYTYGPTNCVAGPLCRFDSFPSVLQVLLIIAGCALLWLLLYVVVERALEAPRSRQTRYERLLSSMSAYPTMRPLLAAYGAVLLLSLLVALYTHRASAPAVVVGTFTAVVCLNGALAGRRPRLPHTNTRTMRAASGSHSLGHGASWPLPRGMGAVPISPIPTHEATPDSSATVAAPAEPTVAGPPGVWEPPTMTMPPMPATQASPPSSGPHSSQAPHVPPTELRP
jgi:hypothetical protein